MAIAIEKELEKYLHQKIPITVAMGIQVNFASQEKVILFAPFAPNLNHQKTIFGGSLHTVCTLACWSLVFIRLKNELYQNKQIIISHSEIAYHSPVNSDFEAICLASHHGEWERFIKMLNSKGKGRISLKATVHHQNRLAVTYHGTFAAI